MRVESPFFKGGESIPEKYSCDGLGINPPLAFEEIPDNATSLALIVDDPDAPGTDPFVHWLVWNIGPDTTAVNEDSLPLGAIEGTGSNGESGYLGPCPPAGQEHRYLFHLLALDNKISLDPEARRADLEKAIDGHIIDEAVLSGIYARQK